MTFNSHKKIQRVLLNDEIDIVHDYPANIKIEDRHLFDNVIKQTVPASELLKIAKASITGDGWIFAQGDIVEESFVPARRTSRKKRFQKKLGQIFSIKPKSKAENCLWITDNWSHNYYHWLTDAIPRLYLARNNGVTADLFLPEICKKPGFIIESLQPFETATPKNLKKTESWMINELFLPTYSGAIANNHPKTINAVAEKFRQYFGDNERAGRRIYISRKTSSIRAVKNETELLPVLEKFGFEIANFENLSFSEQVKLASSCEAIAGPHGAGITNVMFMPPGGKVFEFHPGAEEVNTCYFTLANILNHSYNYVIADRCNDMTASHKDNMLVDPTELEACFEQAFRRSEG